MTDVTDPKLLILFILLDSQSRLTGPRSSKFEYWLGSLCCVLGEGTLLDCSASLHPGDKMGNGELLGQPQ